MKLIFPPPPPPPLFTSYTNSGLKRNKCDVTNFWMNISSWSHINEHIYMYIIKILSSRHPLHMRDTFFFIIHSFFIRTSNFAVEAERKVDVLIFFLWFEPETFLHYWFASMYVMTYCQFPFSLLFPGDLTLLFLHSWEWQEDNSLTSTNFSLKLLHSYPLYFDKENATR